MILQKIIAQSGYSSRRQAEKLIREGAVKVNGRVATVGQEAEPEGDVITVKGKVIGTEAEKIYIKLNKPGGYVSTNRRFPGEKNIFELVKLPTRLFAVGRLDKGSRGLVLLTNDGGLAQRLAHPRFGHEKVYEAKVSGKVEKPQMIAKKLVAGVDIGLGDGIAKAKRADYLQKGIFVITLDEGKKRQLRRMFKALELEVVDLRRISLASLKLGSLPEGKWAQLTKEEINNLKT